MSGTDRSGLAERAVTSRAVAIVSAAWPSRGEDWSQVVMTEWGAVAVVADGAGGHPTAQAAARYAGHAAIASLIAAPASQMALFEAVSAAQGSLQLGVSSGVISPDAATTLLIVCAKPDGTTLVSTCGDSFVICTSADGNEVRLPDELSMTSAFLTPQTRAVPIVSSFTMREGDVVAVCSDGVLAGVTSARPRTASIDAALALIDAARARGSRDDATVVLLSLRVGHG